MLNDPNWSIAKNDAWIKSGITNKQNFLVVSEATPANLISANPLYSGPTVFARELNMLYTAKYVKIGDFLVHPLNII